MLILSILYYKMFCSIEDAWGSDFDNDGKSLDSDKSEEFRAREYTMTESSDNSKSESKQYSQYMKLKEKFGQHYVPTYDDKVCIAVNTHINKCSVCRARYLQQQKPTIDLSQFMNSIVEKFHANSDAITLILICIMILLIIKLFNK